MKKTIHTLFKNFISRFFSEDLEIEYRLGNLIMLCTDIGCLIAFILSLVINQDLFASITIFIALVVVTFCIYLAAWKKKNNAASLIVIIVVNEIIFPFLFISCGGIHSGMVCWFIVGLVFPFLVLQGAACYLVFGFSLLTLAAMFLLEYFGLVPIEIKALSGFGWVEDVVQSMGLVALLFGIICRFQAKIYKKQNSSLKESESELKESLVNLEKANAAKSSFLANMSHEIRTPINAIMGMDEIILRDCKDPEILQSAASIQSASNSLLSLVNDILDFSKIEAGKMEITPVDYSLSSLLVDCYNMVHLRAINKGLELNVTNDPELPDNLNGDEFHVRQIVTNLLTNAVKYTKTGSVTIDVSFEKSENNIVKMFFKVSDTGVGIAKENLDMLFKSFQRIDEKKNRSIEGTGLGLSIAYKLAEQMGGTITVESEEGKGSVFTAIIPQEVIGESKLGNFNDRYNDSKKINAPSTENVFEAPDMKILAVDDVMMNLTVIKGLLKKTKINVVTALSGSEMLTLTEKEKFDIIFLDHMMPEMDGIEALHELRKRENINLTTPVIALTANAIIGVEEQYLSEGFDGYLSKPVRGKDLEEAIKKYTK